MKIISTLLSVLLLVSPLAQAKDAQLFDINRADAILKSAESVLNNKFTSFERLSSERDKLSAYIESARKCAIRQEDKLESIEKIKLSLGIKTNDISDTNDSADVKYIKNRAKGISKRLGDCRLYQLRADSVLSDYQERLASGARERMWKKGPPIWSLIYQLTETKETLIAKNHYMDLSILSTYNALEIGLLIIATSILTIIARAGKKKYLSHYHLSNTWITLTTFSITAVSLLFYHSQEASLTKLFACFFLYFSLMVLLILSSQTSVFERIAQWIGLSGRYLKNLGQLVLHLLILNRLLTIGVHWDNMPEILYHFLTVLLVSAVYLMVLYLCRSTVQRAQNAHVIGQYAKFINVFISGILSVGLVMNLLGYGVIANYLATNTVVSFIYFAAFTLFYRLVMNTYYYFSDKKSQLHQKIHQHLGVKLGQGVFEITLLTHLIITGASIILAYFIIGLWDLSRVTDDRFYKLVVEGFVFINMHVLPLDLMLGLFIFSCLNMLCRVIATRLSQGDKKTKVVISDSSGIAQLIYYIGSSISLLIALFMAGISLTGIAIVAGALSVGIGLGLKSIVNNFIAGIILLIEKPIRIGDFITINDVTGTVKGIGARSTHIVTRKRVEVIVPNEDLITTQVSNFMFENPLLRIECPVGVGYDSDLRLVEKLLYEIAKEHPKVISDDPARSPNVQLRGFGSSSIDFELRAVITDVVNRNNIRSELFFAINERFKEHNIEIPFPQVVCHSKQNPYEEGGEAQ